MLIGVFISVFMSQKARCVMISARKGEGCLAKGELVAMGTMQSGRRDPQDKI